MSAVDDMVAAFQEYETAIERAQRSYHNYQEWTRDEWGPIEAASARFYEAAASAARETMALALADQHKSKSGGESP